MPKFSSYFGLNAPQAQLDFVDVSNDEDTPVFVDPFAIEIRSDPWSNACAEDVRSFFDEVLSKLRSGDEQTVRYLLGQLHEPSETFLGLSSGKPKGRGVGAYQAYLLAEAIRNSEAFTSGQLEDLSELALYVEGINRDKVSDLTTNIIRKRLLEYTQSQCLLYGIDTEDYSGPPMWDSASAQWRSATVKVPYIEDDPVILVPKAIVRRSLSLNATDFYSKHVLTFLQSEHVSVHGSLSALVRGKRSVAEVKKGVVKKPPKEKLRKVHPKSASLILDIVREQPNLLEYYKGLAAERRELLTISDDDSSLSYVCTLLAAKLPSIPTGQEHANEYHQFCMGALTAVFFPELAMPMVEWEINHGRKRVDIVFMNDAREGFLQQRRDAANTSAAMVIVECKNYSKDINNPEIDQLLGRFDNNRGRFGWLLCRSIDDKERLLDRCRDLAKGGSGFIITLTDEDMIELLKAKATLSDVRIQRLLMAKYRDLIS